MPKNLHIQGLCTNEFKRLNSSGKFKTSDLIKVETYVLGKTVNFI